MDKKRWADPGDLKRCILRSRRRVGWCEFSARLLIRKPCSWRADNPISDLAAPYERSLSVTSTSGAKPCFLSSLRSSFTAAALPRVDFRRDLTRDLEWAPWGGRCGQAGIDP